MSCMWKHASVPSSGTYKSVQQPESRNPVKDGEVSTLGPNTKFFFLYIPRDVLIKQHVNWSLHDNNISFSH